MNKINLLIILLSSFIIALIIGLLSYFQDKKKMYSFLGMFPFELKSNNNPLLNLIFRIVLALSISAMSIDAIYLLINNISSVFLTKTLGYLLIVSSIILITMFIIDFKSLNTHILGSSIFVTFVFIDYLFFGYIALINLNDNFFLYQGIIAIVISVILLLIIVYPSLSSWYKMKKIRNEKTKEEKYERKRVNILALLEWISIFLFVGLFILISLSNII